MGKGWIRVYRQLRECWIWEDKEPFDKRSAWLDLLLIANHADKKILFNGRLITIERGQILTSVRKLSDNWKWSVNKVYRFLKVLEGDCMIKRESDKDRTLITIVNYGIYQGAENTDENSNGNSNGNGDGNSNGNSDEYKGETPTEHKQECKEYKELNNITISNDIVSPELLKNSEIELPLNDKSLYPIYQTDVDEWKELYPAVDVMQELRKMKGWLNSNPSRRKTKRGIKRFINSWLAKVQDNTPSGTGTAGNDFMNEDYEKAWMNTVDRYPKKRRESTAKQIWMKRLLAVKEEDRKQLATNIYKAISLFLTHYGENSNDTKYEYIPKFDEWLTEDCDYWLRQLAEGKQK